MKEKINNINIQSGDLRQLIIKYFKINNNLDKNHVSPNSLIPIYIITGFLGSGKTTLLNNILKSPDHNKKFAVIVNEVGSVSIDHTLIEQNMGVVDDGIIVMKNGCMCCVSSGTSGGIKGTSRILEQLVRISDSGIAELDGVFVELSGLADPSPTILVVTDFGSQFSINCAISFLIPSHSDADAKFLTIAHPFL